MEFVFRRIPVVPWLLLLASCASPPKPPAVDAALRRPANAPSTIELQSCNHELFNSRLKAAELARIADAAAADQADLGARQQLLRALQSPVAASERPNRVFTIRFAFASTHVELPEEAAQAVISAARAAPLVMLRGRTDGTDDSVVESRMARRRAAAVRDYLIANGVAAQSIRTTHQPIGDHVAPNVTWDGRGQNRRVEIEVYQLIPVQADVATSAQQ